MTLSPPDRAQQAAVERTREFLYSQQMFSRFERFLKPTATPEHPEPPAGLLGFLWHFARQAKPLFIALFVVEFFVALTDAAVPWFMGRIVTFVSAIPPDRFLAETWPWLVGMLLVVVVARPAVALTRYLITNQAKRISSYYIGGFNIHLSTFRASTPVNR